MKKLLIAAALLAAASPAFAQTSRSESQSQAIAIAGGNGNDGSVQRTRGRLATTASAIAPGLTAAGVHSCAGSTSAAGGGTGFGFSFGTTYEMVECNRRAYAATLQGMGQNAAALALICNNAEVQNALNLTGVVCPQQQAQVAVARVASSARPDPLLGPARGAQGSVSSSGGVIIRSATPWRD